MKKLNIAIIGNLCNVGYNLLEILKKDFNVRLYITYLKKHELDQYSDILKKDNVFSLNTTSILMPYHIYKISRWTDIMHAHTMSPIYARLFKKKDVPMISQCHGADIRELSYQKSLLGNLLNKAYRESKIIFYVTPDLHIFLKEKKLAEKSYFLPNYADVPKRRVHRNKKSQTILVPTNYAPIKGLATFYKGFKLFENKYPDINIKLLIINVSGSDDYAEFVKSYAPKNYLFISRLPRKKLYRLYEDVDIIVDQFKLGAMGLNSLDPLAHDKHVLAYHARNYDQYYSAPPPLMNCKTPHDVLRNLEDYYVKKTLPIDNPKGSDWIQDNHSKDVILKTYKTALSEQLSHIRHKQDKESSA